MKRKPSLPALVQLAIFTLVTTIVWLGYEVYQALTAEPIETVDAAILEPLDPTLDTFTLEGLLSKVQLSDNEIGDTQLIGNVSQPSPPTQEDQQVLEELEQILDDLDNQETETATQEGQVTNNE